MHLRMHRMHSLPLRSCQFGRLLKQHEANPQDQKLSSVSEFGLPCSYSSSCTISSAGMACHAGGRSPKQAAFKVDMARASDSLLTRRPSMAACFIFLATNTLY